MQRSVLFRVFTLIILMLSQSSIVASDKNEEGLPLWEIGLGVGAVHQSYYTGTKQSRVVLLPIPVPVYRGDILKSDDEGVRAQLFKNDRVKLDLSMDFNPQLKSEDIDLREGMDDIDNIVQIGPSIEVSLSKKDKSRLNLNLPFRTVFEIGEDGIENRGFNFSPHLTYHRDFMFADNPWVAGISLGPQFGNADYHDIYYGVGTDDVLQNRTAFKTESGYSGSRLQFTMKSNNSKRLLLGFLRYENINGATFEDSPLVETKDNLVIGFLYSRYFFKSKKRVQPKKRN